ncbi:Uncharacterized protein HZ326_9296 [Fusarium oxysporum f. sp. albedinis]|nr:Uncharacterized protein HZ326_9296 [Fusarium oxysporum f. sp. albedinis]
MAFRSTSEIDPGRYLPPATYVSCSCVLHQHHLLDHKLDLPYEQEAPLRIIPYNTLSQAPRPSNLDTTLPLYEPRST